MIVTDEATRRYGWRKEGIQPVQRRWTDEGMDLMRRPTGV